LPRLELVAKKYECAGINSNVSAAVFGGHFDTRLMQYLASRMVNMVARYNRLRICRAPILICWPLISLISFALNWQSMMTLILGELATLHGWYMRAGLISLQFNVTPPHWAGDNKIL
jgi:hypothetical protein